jgi:hypothetical protein
MAVYTEAIQKLYVAYFNRPADYEGLAFWEKVLTAKNGDLAFVSSTFAKSPEYQTQVAGKSYYQIVNQIYNNLFNRDADVTGLEFWAARLSAGTFTVDQIVKIIADNASDTDAKDKTTYANKVAAATAFTAELNTAAEIIGYSGATANAAAKAWLSTVSTTESLQAAIAPAALQQTVATVTTPFVEPMNVTLTTGVDTFVGKAGNDVITATTAAGANGLTTFDNIDGGAGTDTIRFVDTASAAAAQFSLPTGATVSNIEVVSVATTGGLDLDTTSWAGVNAVSLAATGTAAVDVTIGNTTNLTLASATTGTTDITGGRGINAALSDATAGNVTVTGAALTNVTLQGGAVATVDNLGGAAGTTTATGTTLTAVTLDGVTGATAALKGAALTNVTLKNIEQATAVTVTNGTAKHSLNLTVENAGYDAAGAAVAGVSVADATATTINVTANTKSNVSVSGAAATSIVAGGAGALTLGLAGATAATSIDATASTGGVTLTGIAAGVLSINTGAGNDKFTVTAATVADDTATTGVNETKDATISTGAGNDTVTLTTTGNGKVNLSTGAGNDTVIVTSRGTEILNIDLGEGNDTLTASVAINGTDVINAGAGTDTLALSLVGAANIGAFSNFDLFDAKGLNRALDVEILSSKNTVTEFVASGDVGAAVLNNVGAGVGVRVTGDMAASTLSVQQKTAGALTVTVDADETATTGTDAGETITGSIITNATSVKAVFDTAYLADTTAEKALALTADNYTKLTVAAADATTLEVTSGGANSVNEINTTASAKLTTLTVTGAQALVIGTVDVAKLATIDASAHTGGLTVGTDDVANNGIIRLGSGVDAVTVASSSIAAGAERVSGFEKAIASAVGTDVTAAAAAQADADTLVFTGGAVANANAGVTTGTIAKGVLTFTGAGPTDLAAAFVIANNAADAVGEVVVFEYLGNSYVFQQGAGGAADIVGDKAIQLVGVTGVTQIGEIGTTDAFFLV